MTNEKSRGKVFREIYASVVFIWKLLRVTAAIGTKAAKLWGVQQHLSSNPLCKAEELWGAGSLARDGGLVACVALPQRHWCLLMFPRSCTKNPARLFSLSLKLLNTAHPQVVARPSGSPAGEAFFFSHPAHPNPPVLFPCLAARSFGLQFLQRIEGHRAERQTEQWTGTFQPVRVLTVLSFPAAVQAHDFPPAHTRQRSASFPFVSHLSSVSHLHTSLLSAD